MTHTNIHIPTHILYGPVSSDSSLPISQVRLLQIHPPESFQNIAIANGQFQPPEFKMDQDHYTLHMLGFPPLILAITVLDNLLRDCFQQDQSVSVVLYLLFAALALSSPVSKPHDDASATHPKFKSARYHFIDAAKALEPTVGSYSRDEQLKLSQVPNETPVRDLTKY